ncbi:MAG: DNA-binding response regulator [Bacteroidetes bacterium]|nr:MAG: DNA-binding response regulator [Bacteroidota bacterium]
MTNNLLLIEDDFTLGDVIKSYLSSLGYRVIWAQNATTAFKLFNTEEIAICLVDIGLPDRDGFDVVKDMKLVNKSVPILFLTSRNQIDDKIKAYEIGADDYLCKPFEMKELELRISALKKRFGLSAEESGSNVLCNIGSIQFNPLLRRLKTKEGQVKLSHIDCELLKLLYLNRNKYIQNEIILKAIWGNNDKATYKRLSVYINRLRNLLKNSGNVHIDNVYGLGYKLQIDLETPNY